jgi:hypothetical protein
LSSLVFRGQSWITLAPHGVKRIALKTRRHECVTPFRMPLRADLSAKNKHIELIILKHKFPEGHYVTI